MGRGLPPREAPNSYVLYEDVAYDEFWRGMGRQKLDQLEHAIVRELLPKRGRRILDLGCGYGRLADCYVDRFDEVVLFDGSLSLLKIARQRIGSRPLYIWGDANHLPFCEATFDAMLLVRVLHHLPDIESFLSQARSILCRNATLVLSYSNKRNALRAMRFLLGGGENSPFTEEPLAVEPNFIHHHPRYIAAKLLASGLKHSLPHGAGVFDALAGLLGPLGRFVPAGMGMASVLGRTQVAPWIFCKGIVEAGAELEPARALEELLVCPSCHAELRRVSQGFHCAGCGTNYPIIDGIIDLRPTDAQEGHP